MAPNTEKMQVSFPHLKYPQNRDLEPKLPSQWMNGRKFQDGAEGLWRVHDGLYDLSEYITRHPGGAYWLKTTKVGLLFTSGSPRLRTGALLILKFLYYTMYVNVPTS
jgi:hypothetical protein